LRSPSAYLLVLVGLLCVGNLWTTFHRSGIPVALTGRIERVEVRPEKHPGLDDVHLVTVSGRTTHLDAEVASLLLEGDEIRKASWSAELTTPRGTSRLDVSRDSWRMLLAMPILLGLAVALLRWRARAPAEEDE